MQNRLPTRPVWQQLRDWFLHSPAAWVVKLDKQQREIERLQEANVQLQQDNQRLQQANAQLQQENLRLQQQQSAPQQEPC
jgi:cell division protein FtsB